jgi:hypothetical protein
MFIQRISKVNNTNMPLTILIRRWLHDTMGHWVVALKSALARSSSASQTFTTTYCGKYLTHLYSPDTERICRTEIGREKRRVIEPQSVCPARYSAGHRKSDFRRYYTGFKSYFESTQCFIFPWNALRLPSLLGLRESWILTQGVCAGCCFK